MYRIVSGVTSDVGVPSTYLVLCVLGNFKSFCRVIRGNFWSNQNMQNSALWLTSALSIPDITYIIITLPTFWPEMPRFPSTRSNLRPQCDIKYAISPLTWWHHQMKTFSALLAFCSRNSPVTGEFPAQRPVTRSFDVFFDLCLNRRMSKQLWGWRGWRRHHAHYDVTVMNPIPVLLMILCRFYCIRYVRWRPVVRQRVCLLVPR